jgi:hypothetical protein
MGLRSLTDVRVGSTYTGGVPLMGALPVFV